MKAFFHAVFVALLIIVVLVVLMRNVRECTQAEQTDTISYKFLLADKAMGNHPIPRFSANQIASFQPRDAKMAVPCES